MAFCTQCGKEIAEGLSFCNDCLAAAGFAPVVPSAPQSAPQYTVPQPAPQPQYTAPPQYQQPYGSEPYGSSRYTPIKAWGYFGYNLLFSIPIVGFVFLIVYSFDDSNINRRNYARSFFCGLLIALAVSIISFIILLATGTLMTIASSL